MVRPSIVAAAVLGATACVPVLEAPDPETPAPTPGPSAVEELVAPAPEGARFPDLVTSPDGDVVLVWTRATEGGAAVELARRDDEGTFAEPTTLVERADLLVNWADVGSVALGRDHWAGYWLQRSAGGYQAWVARSDDAGATWSPGVQLSDHDGPGEHGFVVALPADDGTTRLAWLDGRKYADDDAEDETMLLARTLDASGALGPEEVLDDRACDCCPTSGAVVGDGALVAYRDRTEDEVRDIAVAPHDGARWGEADVPVADGWTIAGCPVNGPAVVSSGSSALLAWLTSADDSPRVQAVRLSAEGDPLGAPITIAMGRSVLGRVDALLQDDGAAFVTWVAQDDGDTVLRGRWLLPDDTTGEPFDIAALSPGSAAGAPRIVGTAEGVLVAWTAPTDPPTVRLGILR